MTTFTGNSPQKTFSASSKASVGVLSGFAICLLAGGLVWAVDAWLRLPLHLPGWRGLFVMAILVGARAFTRLPWAASATACSAAALAFAAGDIDPRGVVIYLLPGLVIDFLGLFGPAWRNSPLGLGLGAGIANAVRFLGVLAFGAGFHGAGLLMPLSSHFLFGLIGGVLAGVLSMARRGK